MHRDFDMTQECNGYKSCGVELIPDLTCVCLFETFKKTSEAIIAELFSCLWQKIVNRRCTSEGPPQHSDLHPSVDAIIATIPSRTAMVTMIPFIAYRALYCKIQNKKPRQHPKRMCSEHGWFNSNYILFHPILQLNVKGWIAAVADGSGVWGTGGWREWRGSHVSIGVL